jgi:hypothetical protein
MTEVPRRTMGERCPICRKDISQLLPISDYPNLCKECADKERTYKSKRMVGGRIIPPDQKTLKWESR